MANLNTKYRPQTFDEVVGQNITTKLLKRIIETGNIKNCYLFCGTSGSGKTTLARCFAKAINKGVGDSIEIDAASNASAENIRDLMSTASQRSLVGEYKIFIIDEAHSISSAGWNAFLKGIEETPKYTIFIFCTTDPQKIPNTILNRMQRYNFAPISTAEIYNRLIYICQQEGFTNYEHSCDLISKVSHGEMRRAITYLDQISDYSHQLDVEITKSILGGLSFETFFKLTLALTKEKSEEMIISLIDELFNSGNDLKDFISLYLDFIIDLNKFLIFKNIDITNIPRYLATPENPAVQFIVDFDDSRNIFNKIADKLLELKSILRYDLNYKSTILIYLLQICRGI